MADMAEHHRQGRLNVIEKLENNEQILLMYLADELPGADRIEVEQMLGSDASLRGELDRLQEVYQFVDRELARFEQTQPTTLHAEFAARSVGREIRQRLARPKVASSAPGREESARSWRWLYPTAAAAAILVGAMLWLDHEAGVIPSSVGGPVAIGNPNPGLPDVPPPDRGRPEMDPYAIFERSLLTPPDEDIQKEAVAQANPSDAMPQDDLSQLLLSAGPHGQ
jgi:hypothetical protein